MGSAVRHSVLVGIILASGLATPWPRHAMAGVDVLDPSWAGVEYLALPTGGFPESEAVDANDFGHVTGTLWDPTSSIAVVWQPRECVPPCNISDYDLIEFPEPPVGLTDHPVAISNVASNGFVVIAGYRENATANRQPTAWRFFANTPENMTVFALPQPTGFGGGEALDVNDAGTVVGTVFSTADGTPQGVAWDFQSSSFSVIPLGGRAVTISDDGPAAGGNLMWSDPLGAPSATIPLRGGSPELIVTRFGQQDLSTGEGVARLVGFSTERGGVEEAVVFGDPLSDPDDMGFIQGTLSEGAPPVDSVATAVDSMGQVTVRVGPPGATLAGFSAPDIDPATDPCFHDTATYEYGLCLIGDLVGDTTVTFTDPVAITESGWMMVNGELGTGGLRRAFVVAPIVPRIALSPSGFIDLGTVPVGSATGRTVLLLNQGGADLVVTDIVLFQAGSDFSLTAPTLPATVDPGGFIVLGWEFAPTQAGFQTADALITSNDPLNGLKSQSAIGFGEAAGVCGDGSLDAGEECDDGNNIDGDGCDAVCVIELCGDGIVNGGAEECDDGNTDPGDGCDDVCVDEFCGDGIINDVVETCDDGNAETEACEYGQPSCTVCNTTCSLQPGDTSFCGDGVLDAGGGEECDDGNNIDGDGCDAVCVIEICGDGIVNGGAEECDDGNTLPGDGCDDVCIDEFCGDGIINDVVETCDDGNAETEACEYGLPSCTVCDTTCSLQPGDTSFCGDGVLDAGGGEECDDGSNLDGDGCSAACVIEGLLSVADVEVLEGDDGTVMVAVTLTLDDPVTADVTALVDTVDDTARAADGDFAPLVDESVTITAGETEGVVTVGVNGDRIFELDETLSVVLHDVTGATATDPTAAITLLNDDAPPELTIQDSSVVEGDFGTTDLTFELLLDQASGVDTPVEFATTGGTATPGEDYEETDDEVIIPAGQVIAYALVPVLGDTEPEGNETIVSTIVPSSFFRLSPVGGIATGTIIDDDGGGGTELPTLSITGPDPTREGTSRRGFLQFEATLSRTSDTPVFFNFITQGGSARSDDDFVATSGVGVVIPAGVRSRTFTVETIPDDRREPDETFGVRIFGASGATIGVDQVQAVILNDDARPEVRILDNAVVEGTLVSNVFEFTVQLDRPSDFPIEATVHFDGDTARAGSDFLAPPSDVVVTFPPGVVTQTVGVALVPDFDAEDNEMFLASISGAVNATIVDRGAVGTILDDDGAPGVVILDASTPEGTPTGHNDLEFRVVRVGADTDVPVSVDFVTEDGSAVGGSTPSPPRGDFVHRRGTVTFSPGGPRIQTIEVDVRADFEPEGDEVLTVVIGNPRGGAIFDDEASGTIVNDDSAPVTVEPERLSTVERGTAELRVELDGAVAPGFTGSLDFQTRPGTATPGADFTPTSGTLRFSDSRLEQFVVVPLIDDDEAGEAPETIYVDFVNAVNLLLPRDGVTLVVHDDDALPVVSVTGGEAYEGVVASFVIRLSEPSDEPVTVTVNTLGGTAGDGDYQSAVDFQVTIPPGAVSRTLLLSTVRDDINETDETFSLLLSDPVGATLGTRVAEHVILNDDPLPRLSVSDGAVVEGNDGTREMTFTVYLYPPTEQTVSVRFQTDGQSATEGDDYTGVDTVVTFPPGVVARTVSVPITTDSSLEPDEQFLAILSEPMNATLDDDLGVGTIANDDGGERGLVILDASQPEGSGDLVFTVLLTGAPSDQPVSVEFATEEGTAYGTPDSLGLADYVSQRGTLTFAPGEQLKTIRVPLLDDDGAEILFGDAETFSVNLALSVGAPILRDQAVGTIIDDDLVGVEVRPASERVEVNLIESSPSLDLNIVYTRLQEGASGAVGQLVASSGSAALGEDFAGAPLRLDPQGSTVQNVQLPLFDDDLAEGPERFTVDFVGSVPAVVNPPRFTVRIEDDDLPAGLENARSIQAQDAAAYDALGTAVDTDGHRVAVGAPGDNNDNGVDAGSVHLFRRAGGGFENTAELVSDIHSPGARFGTSLDLDGDELAVGAPGIGEVYLFSLGLDGWELDAIFGEADGLDGDADHDGYGASVALEGDSLAVGAPGTDSAGLDAGAVYVYERVDSAWMLTATLLASDSRPGDRSGTSVSLDGTVLAAGAPGDDGAGAGAGSITLFERDGGAWMETVELTGALTAAGDGLGSDVAVDGEAVLGGAPGAEGRGGGTGAAIVFRAMNGFWIEEASLVANDGSPGDGFGGSVDLDGPLAIIGAAGDNEAAGTAYAFMRGDGGGWSQTGKLLPDGAQLGDGLGGDVSLARGTMAVGAPGDDVNPEDAGSVWVIETCFGVPATLVGTDDADDLLGTSARDVIAGLDDADLIDGSGGDDRICGGDGPDGLIGGTGADLIDGGPGDDVIDGGSGADDLFGGSGDDRLDGGTGDDLAVGGPGHDELAGGQGDDWLEGNEGDDDLLGGRGSDLLDGGDGDDCIDGGRGDNQVDCGDGLDVIVTGGAGADASCEEVVAEPVCGW